MYAHYFQTKGRRFVVISATVRPVGEEIDVASKVEARRIAGERGARCWNF